MGPMSANAGVSEFSLASIPGSCYAGPVFSWAESRGITEIEFLNSTAIGSNYENGVLAGDIISGTLYYFQPNADRTGISLGKESPLSDLLGTITKTEFLIAVPLNRRGEWDLKYWYDLRLANSQNRLS